MPALNLGIDSMKILHLVPSYKPAYIYGGTITAISILCESQASLGHQVMVYTTTANGEKELEVVPSQSYDVEGVEVRYFRRITKDHTHFSPTLLRTLWQTAKAYDVIQLHSWWNLVSMPVVFVCWLRGIKPVFSPHGMLSTYSMEQSNSRIKSLFHKTFGKFLLRRTVLHATSTQEVNEGKQMIPKWEHIIVSNIVELPASQNRRVGENDVFTIVFLSRIDHKKGIHLLLNALAKVQFDFRLQIAGKGDADYEALLKTRIQQLDLTDRVEWMGWMSGEDKYRFLAQADLFALTSYNENFAMVVVESLAMGTPVLVSDKVGLSDYVAANDLGWICNLDPQQIVKTLENAYQDSTKRANIRNRAITKAYQDFAPTRIAQEYVLAYQGIA